MIWLYANAVPEASIVASSNALGYGASRLKDKSLSTKLKFAGRAHETVEFEFEEEKRISGACVLGHNLSPSATLTLEANEVPSWTTPSFSQEISIGQAAVALFEEKAYKYWRLVIEDNGNENNVELGLVYLGKQITIGEVSLEAEIPVVSVDIVSDTRSGQVYGHQTYQYYAPSFNLAYVTEETRQAILKAWRSQGQTEPWVLLIWEESLDQFPALYVRFTMSEFSFLKQGAAGLAYSSSFSCKEVF